jgi:hypothetical protein
MTLNQIRRECGQSFDLFVRPTVFNRYILTLNVAGLL